MTGQRFTRPDASMSLLADLMNVEALDPGYAEAAARGSGSRTKWGFVVLILCGLLLAVAVLHVRRGEPEAKQARNRLIAEVQARTASTDRLSGQVASLRAEVARLQSAQLARSTEGRATEQSLARLGRASGAVPVNGPGLRVVLDDARSGEVGRLDPGRVYDHDLQLLANDLWAAGAQGIAINGQRLTALTAIRSAGQAILVDLRPISPPYEVTVLGDPDDLLDRFADSRAGRQLRTLKSTYGLRFDVSPEETVRLPAASLTLRHAQGSPR